MSVDYAALVRTLGAKGMTPAEIADVIEAMTIPAPVYEIEAALSPAQAKALATIEKRRAYDRMRKANSTGKSTGTAENPPEPVETDEAHSPSLSLPPSPPNPPPPPPPHPHAHEGARARANPKPPKTKRCPAEWAPDERMMAWATETEGFSAGEIERELSKLKDHQFQQAHSDWPAVFRNWLRRVSDNRQKSRPTHERPGYYDRKADDFRRSLADVDRAMEEAFQPERHDAGGF